MTGWWRRRGRLSKAALLFAAALALGFGALLALVAVERSRVAAMEGLLRSRSPKASLARMPVEWTATWPWFRERCPDAAFRLDQAAGTHVLVGADGCDLSDAEMAFLAPRAAQNLDAARNPRLTDAGFTGVGRAKELQFVELSGAVGVGDATLARLAAAHGATLCHLRLNDTGVGDAGLAALRRAPKLARLDLSRARVTDAGLAALGELPALDMLGLDGLPITDRGVEALLRPNFTRRDWVSLCGTNVTDAGVTKLLAGGWRHVLVGGPNIAAVRLESLALRPAGADYPPGSLWVSGRFRIDEKLAGPVEKTVELPARPAGRPRSACWRGAAYVTDGAHSCQTSLTKWPDGTWAFDCVAEYGEYPPGTKLAVFYKTPGAVQGALGADYQVGEAIAPAR